ncbi:hypothetical protein LY78DRAFT_491098 [Colletotrichum sublineola]|nr:hypothetical protein LY78DRAFT_491098 [Colletotrichum sublineola]
MKRKPSINRPGDCDCKNRTALCSSLDIGEGGFPPSKIYAHKRPPGPLLPYPHRRVVFVARQPLVLLAYHASAWRPSPADSAFLSKEADFPERRRDLFRFLRTW